MTDNVQIHANRLRAESFGSIAANYDRYRPGYPPALINELMTLAPRRVLDIGCGTGKAARMLAERGVEVLGVEIDERMADVARSHGIDVEVASFESWDDRGRTFDMIISGQAWHWVDPVAGPVKAARLLEPGGTMALFWNTDRKREPLATAIDNVYSEQVPEIKATIAALKAHHQDRPYVEPIEASGLFESVDAKYFDSERVDNRDQWLGMIGTHSDHVTLEPARRERLLASVASIIDEAGGTIAVDVSTYLVLAKTPGRE